MDIRTALRHTLDGGRFTSAEAREVFGHALTERVDPVALGALLAALAQRGETRAEVTGAAEALRAAMTPFEHDAQETSGAPGAIDTCGTGGDGLGTFNLSTAAALVAAGAGARVVKHGNRAVSSASGSADVLEAAGGRVDVDPRTARAALEACGFTFLFAPRYHPAMRHAAPARRALGTPTIFNLLGPLCSPGRVARQVVGVATPRRVGLIAGALEDLGAERAYVVHGAGGADELTLAGVNRALAVGAAMPVLVDPLALGLASAPVEALAGGDAASNARTLARLLDPREAGAGELRALRDATLLNAALATLVAGLDAELGAALERCRAALESGRAGTVLARWIAATRKEVAA